MEITYNVTYKECGICDIEMELFNNHYEATFEYGTFFAAVCYELDDMNKTSGNHGGMAFIGQVGVTH